MTSKIDLQAEIPFDMAGKRLDQVLAQLFSDYSRSRLTQWLADGCITVDGRNQLKPREKVVGGELVTVSAALEEEVVFEPEAIPLSIEYEDADIIVINKPADFVVHPGAGNREGTLLNALLHHAPELANIPRAGIVHRLDKDTTGLMVVAKTLAAQTDLVAQLQARSVTREYEAVAIGTMTAGGSVDEPIGRHPTQRTLMAVNPFGRPSVTHYRVAEKFRAHTFLRLRLETGRTHQIRVHMAHLKHPLVGDPGYGGRPRLPAQATPELIEVLRGFGRQALHARRLELVHPSSGERMGWEVDTPDDMQQLLAALREDTRIWRESHYEMD